MPHPKKKTAQRGIVAAAATALVVGSSFMPALAAPTASESPSAPATADDNVSDTSGSVDTTGLAEAIERDLGETPEEYLAEAKVSAKASDIKTALREAKIDSNVVVKDGVVVVQVGKGDLSASKKVIAEVEAAETTVAGEEVVQATATATAEAAEESVPAAVAPTEATKKAEKVEKKSVEPSATEKATESAAVEFETEEVSSIDEVLKKLKKTASPEALKELTSVTIDEHGQVIVRAGEASKTKSSEASESASKSNHPELSLTEAIERLDGAKLKLSKDGGPATPAALEDVYGGMGYATTADGDYSGSFGICSVGLNAWNAEGEDAVITAGHCTTDGSMKDVNILEHDAINKPSAIGIDLGTFGFSQFGTAGNGGHPWNPEEAGDWEIGTDIAVIDAINPAANLHPAVTKWPAGVDEREATINITSAGAGVVGQSACNSGRTTGWQCSELLEEGVFFVGGYDENGEQTDQSVRTVWGYTGANPEGNTLLPGDSGGSVVQGTRAIGVNSAYGAGVALYTSLVDAQAKTPVKDYAVKLFISAPQITADNGTEVEAGDAITGTVANAADGTKVDIIVEGKVIDTVTVKAGKFSFTAPEELGEFSFTVQAKNGFDKSATTNANVVVIAAPTPTSTPTEEPTEEPTSTPTEEPTEEPTSTPTEEPTEEPTSTPTEEPTEEPTSTPTEEPTAEPTSTPTEEPTAEPTEEPTAEPTEEPTAEPTEEPTAEPSESTSPSPSEDETEKPSTSPSATEDDKSEAPKDQKDDEPTKSVTPKENPKDDDALADTGSNSVPLIAAGGAMALAGAAFLLFRRSARRQG
ncbi:hypothetical protein AARI_15130 [Glutamicibacter arilaitensis Re117]|uniref:Gram-positive cocci surface proteins LPxTG domain-containing protein n=4 Tax=Glutamicibacter TaxID=1742989 RepID=A0ABM9PWM8_GLUAR|nr:trypsin-like serine protease [Glutamicibacter arilaitensis]CBT75735.1 hypothetical protein AARI_15130 [Glutamicibacter arilaitensis Re117]